jgi:cardiolipin synthase
MLNLPNILTIGRIAVIPALVAVYYLDGDISNWTALAIYFLACLTDFFDGYFARTLKQFSQLGKMLDPIADKLLISTVLFLLVWDGIISDWTLPAVIIIMCREFLVAGMREFLGNAQVSVPVTALAKWKTTAQMFSLGFLLAGEAGDKILPYNTEIGISLLWFAAGLTLITGYSYMQIGLKHVVAEDEAAALKATEEDN